MEKTPLPPAQRDVRLDVFRGLAMLIIFVAHLPDNTWSNYIPARFGYSSAAEMFVFCSGLASSMAFGRTFSSHPFHVGLLRVAHRCWQVYWAHIALCLIVMACTAYAVGTNNRDYFEEWGFNWLRTDTTSAVVGLFTLRLMPALLNILPMYLVLLCLIPVVILLSRVHRYLPIAASFALWLTVQFTGLNVYSGVQYETEWFFDPFAWQFLFFTGFSFGMGWIAYPRFERGKLFYVCLAFVLISVPLTFWAITARVPLFAMITDWLMPDTRPIRLHVLRYVHFLAIAYVALTLVEERRHWLTTSYVRPFVMIGQQTLQSFQASIVLACVLGIALDSDGHTMLGTTIGNLTGFAIILAVAWITAFFKSPPWKAKRPAPKPVQTAAGALIPADVTGM